MTTAMTTIAVTSATTLPLVILAHRLVECYGSVTKGSSSQTGSLAGKRVIELGAGAGLAGIVAARLGAAVVVFTEIEKVLPHLTSPHLDTPLITSPHLISSHLT